MKAIRSLVVFGLSLFLLASRLPAASAIFLIRTGQDAQGNPMFRQATSADGQYLNSLNSAMQNSRAVANMLRFYDATQRDHYAQALAVRGYNAAQVKQLLAQFKPDPVYIEVNGNNSGAYNDWKAKFTVVGANGYAQTVTSPRIVFPLGSQVAKSGNWGLIEQTMVHEMAHGVMAKSYGINRLPTTPWLSKSHTGGSQTDQALALIEGYAEFAGAYFTGRLTIAEDKANALASNWYAYDQNTGRIKPWSQLANTEGWVATTLYYIAKRGQNQDAFWKLTRVMTYTAPRNLSELLVNTMKYYPELTPLIQSVLYQTTGGQVGSNQYAARAPESTGAAAPDSQAAPASPETSQGHVTASGETTTSPASPETASTGSDDAYAHFSAAVSGGDAGEIQAAYAGVLAAQDEASASGSSESLVNIQRGGQLLHSLYSSLPSGLPANDPRFQVQGLVSDLMSRQADLETTLASQTPGVHQVSTSSSYEYTPPAAPANSDGQAQSLDAEFNAAKSAMASDDTNAQMKWLNDYGQRFLRNQAARAGAAAPGTTETPSEP